MAGREGHDQGDQREGPGQAHGLIAPRERPTVRLLLLSPADRLLLMQFEDEATGPGGWWCTIGGGVDEGESLEAAARRELFEETGIVEAEIGPVVWTRRLDLLVEGEMRRLTESYFVARVGHERFSTDGFTELERRVVRDMRWWTLAEIAQTPERIFPVGLAGFLGPVLAGERPWPPLEIG